MNSEDGAPEESPSISRFFNQQQVVLISLKSVRLEYIHIIIISLIITVTYSGYLGRGTILSVLIYYFV